MASFSDRCIRAASLCILLLGSSHVAAQDLSPTGPTMAGIAWNCSGWHTVTGSDTCYSLEQQYNITSAQFLAWNPAVSADCGTNFWGGEAYCVRVGAPGPTMAGIASNCDAWHTVVSGDDCSTVEKQYNITSAQFLAWNPAVSVDCQTNFWAGESYCVGVDAAISTSTSASATVSSTTKSSVSSTISSTKTSTSVSIITTATPYSTRAPITSYNLTAAYTATAYPPQHTLAGQPSYCNNWHLVAAGQTCTQIVGLYGNWLTLDQFLAYNPTVGSDCGGLYFGWYVCVGIQAQTSVSIPWSTSVTNVSAPEPTDYAGYVATVVANYTASPQMTGVPTTCQNYYQAETDDTCTTILAMYSYITEEQFFAWNPALNGNCQGLYFGYYYCVANFGNDLPMPPTITASASPTATGTVSTCDAWYMTVPGDNCAAIAEFFGTFSEADFISWNPSVWSTCGNIQEEVYYCVSVPGTPTTRTTALTTTTAASEPTQTGLASDCTQLWLVSAADTCASIISNTGINATDFYDWNPAVGGSNCTDLTPNYYVCVSTNIVSSTAPVSTVTISDGSTIGGGTTTASGVTSSMIITTTSSAATTTTTGGAVVTPTPFRAGMVDGCVRFYFRNDEAALYCYDMAADAGIALSDFYAWNPAVLDDCSGLWADTWYCIGISGPATTISTGVPSPAATS